MVGVSICLTFYGADCTTYYYQKSLRDTMAFHQNKIKERNKIKFNPLFPTNRLKLFFNALFNGSQLIYLCLFLITLIIYIVYPNS